MIHFPPRPFANRNSSHSLILLTGLSFYTSEKTLRAAFEGFGELVEGTFSVA